MAKKTFSVQELKDLINGRLLHTPDEMKDHRIGMAIILEDVLHKTNQYKGFGYLSDHDMATSNHGKTPGIIYGNDKTEHKFFDPSRRTYI